MAKSEDNKIRCSFCGRTQDSVDKLIAGNGAFICNECVKLCLNIIEEDYDEPAGADVSLPEFKDVPRPRQIKAYLDETGTDLVLFDSQLSPMQLRNLVNAFGCEVLDRTALILRIFSDRARTREAVLQVDYARLSYLLPRLAGMHDDLGRQGGTSGSMSNRGSGEKKIELDRRHIEHRMAELRKDLDEVDRERQTQRKARMSSLLPRVSLVGYTNAGKSTILNGMISAYGGDEEKKVFEKDMLFATLDTTVRRISPDGDRKPFLLSNCTNRLS